MIAANTIGVGGFFIVCGLIFAGYFVGLAAGKTEARGAVKELHRIREAERRAGMKRHYAKASRRFEWEHYEDPR